MEMAGAAIRFASGSPGPNAHSLLLRRFRKSQRVGQEQDRN